MSRDHRLLIHGGEITGYEMLKSVKWEAHRGLLFSVPTMLRHLREDGINDPTLFLRKDHSMELLAGDLLRSFFNNQNKQYDMTVKKTREICAWRTPHVLATAIRNVVEFSAQPLIPSETALRLLAISGQLRPTNFEKKIEMITEIVEDMSAWRFELLAALISFLKDCRSPKADLARDLGPVMLLRDGVSLAPPPSRGKKLPDVVREQNQIQDEMAASEVFRVLIDECPSIFGIVTGYDPARTAHHRFNYEDQSLADEEKMSVTSSTTNLYEGITGPTPTSGRRSRAKKASSFYSIIARSASNVSKDSGTSEPGSPGSFSKVSSGGEHATRKMADASAAAKVAAPSSNKRPQHQTTSATVQPSSKPGTESSWQERRPPPVVTEPEAQTLGGTFAVDSPLMMSQSLPPGVQPKSSANPLIKTQNSFSQTSSSSIKQQNSFSSNSGNPLIKTQNSFSQNNAPAIKQQNSFSSNGGNPLIKTQTSFSQNSRPTTPTGLLSARKNLLLDIQSGSATNLVLRSTSPSPQPQELPALDEAKLPVIDSSTAVAPASGSPTIVLQRPIPTYPQSTATQQLLQSPVIVSNVKEPLSKLDADGPTVFEQEKSGRDASRAGPLAPPTGNGIPVASPGANKFEEELRRRASRASTRSLTFDIAALHKEEAEAIKEEQEAAAAAAASSQKQVKSIEPRPLTKPRHSFIPRITSPTQKSDSGGKTFEEKLAERKKEVEAVETSGVSTVVSESRATSSLHQSAPNEEEEKREEPLPPPKPPKPVTMVASSSAAEPPKNGGTFEALLAAKKAEMDSGQSTPARTPSPPPIKKFTSPQPAKGKSFDQVLAERKAQSDGGSGKKPAPPPYPNPNRAVATHQQLPPQYKPAPPAYLAHKRESLTAANSHSPITTPPPNPRPKPIPPRPSLTLQMMDASQRLSHVEVPPSPEANTTSPEVPMEDKLANLRALLKHPSTGGASGPATVSAAESSPPPEDSKKRAPPPDRPPPPGYVRMEKEGGMQIIGDWRTEWSPHYKAQFWVNILTGAVQWEHPQRDRSRSTKQREEQSKNYAPVVTGVKTPETKTDPGKASAFVNKATAAPQPQPVKPSPVVDAAKTLAIARQNSDAQKNLHQGYRRASLKAEDFHSQRSAQFDEAEEMVIGAARAAGETIAQCVFDFTPQDSNNKAEMAIRVGEKLRIYERGADGWWEASKCLMDDSAVFFLKRMSK